MTRLMLVKLILNTRLMSPRVSESWLQKSVLKMTICLGAPFFHLKSTNTALDDIAFEFITAGDLQILYFLNTMVVLVS